jgi:hypothetical protein
MQSLKLHKQQYPIIFLLILACILRMYRLFDLEYTFDELSALSRTEYDSLGEVIDKGVMKLDTHPALVQVFLYYYTLLFGKIEWLVKLPFILAGISSIYVAYNIGKKWFNETTGLLTATVLTCTQFFIFYSVTARPYISGLFLCLVTLSYWLDVLFDKQATKKHFILFAIFAALSALNHHFSMMFAGLCGIIGLFFLSKQNAKLYILACIGAVLIYSPHFPILFYQLNVGGIGAESGGWLDPPKDDFIIQFLLYLFHYSYIFILAFIAIIAFSFFQKKSESTIPVLKIRIALLALFALSFLIGFFYSQKVNPVIQYSTLIFATPCLILFITSFANELNLKFKWAAISILVVIAISSLVIKRKYYDLIFNLSFDTYIQTANKTIEEKGTNNVYSLFKGEPWFVNYYKEKYNSPAKYMVIDLDSLSLQGYKSIYDTLSTKYLILGDFSPSQVLQAANYYPYVYQKVNGYTFETYVLSKEPTGQNLEVEKRNIIATNFENIPERFNLNKDLIVSVDSKKQYRIDSLNEYPISYKIKNTDLHAKEGQTIIAEIQYQSDKPIKGLLCGSTDALKQNIHWAANDIDAFYNPKVKIQKAYVSIYVNQKFNDPENELNIFIWNNKKEQFQISNFSVYIWNNNPYRYSLLSDF